MALLALAVQVVLSFGHVHLDKFAPASTGSAVATGSAAIVPGERTPGHNPGASSDLDCPICALLKLVAVSTPSVPPALPLPARLGSIQLRAAADLASASSPHLLFQARAPPV